MQQTCGQRFGRQELHASLYDSNSFLVVRHRRIDLQQRACERTAKRTEHVNVSDSATV